MAGNYAHMDHHMKSGKSALPSILPPNHGAVQPYTNGIDDSGDEENNRMELEYMNQKRKDLVSENNKKNEADRNTSGNVGTHQDSSKTAPSSSTITNNGNIKIAIATEINMANLMANTHQCK